MPPCGLGRAVPLEAEYVHGIDSKKVFGPDLGTVEVILGMKYIAKANWRLDLVKLRATLVAVPASK
jgi:hypothetical protein